MTEKVQFIEQYKDFYKHEVPLLSNQIKKQLKSDLKTSLEEGIIDIERIMKMMRVAGIAHREIQLRHHTIESVLLYPILNKKVTADHIKINYSSTTAEIVEGLAKVQSLYEKHVSVQSENFRKLLLSLVGDVRVIMIIIIERLDTMRHLSEMTKEEQQEISQEVSYLYAPLAHRMGLYGIKTELEDLSLKYTSYDIYKDIAHKLNETKKSRDAYIHKFIEPVKKRLQENNLKFEIKGRTKSIYSIWNKMRKQQVPFEKVYDLFAIRIIIDCDETEEKSACWRAYSVVTDMYTANTNRLRDWISMPKSNGYESLHITVMGPEGKWVEVQIRTERMDEIAEKGVAAHWKYKGGKSDSANTDLWLKNLRDMLENSSESNKEIIDEFKMQLYNDNIFVFTPKGDLIELPKGASVLDFAFNIHSKVGSKCTGALIDNHHVSFKHILNNGDQVEILTSQQQQPRQDWLNYVCTSKARTHIRQQLKEQENKEAETGRELLLRRLKNWKLEFDDNAIIREAKKAGYKTLTQFYVAINQEKINLQLLRAHLSGEEESNNQAETPRSAEGFVGETELQKITKNTDALVIDKNLKNIDYTLAKCCNPIFGDDIFGFVTVNGGIKIHKSDCPNAPAMISKFGYRIVKATWAGTSAKGEYTARLRIIGKDDIGIVTNITSIINKETGIILRSISVDSHEGLFEGNITVVVNNTAQIETLCKKLTKIKGVKQVYRI
ncbi:MAG: bifunctional (p)ppGpp synthetase/guanosine-3',5'-bis(diphosphate) 3'-pyrophosphohydrolase [Paludibacteraceae bacterium]|nr:bifunctional (p)ppGpp synthetase/guanosine-3',5'-bis(diphosphate) 3'-pyrophosphohydrolase [Paludibacteraceae bacterium]